MGLIVLCVSPEFGMKIESVTINHVFEESYFHFLSDPIQNLMWSLVFHITASRRYSFFSVCQKKINACYLSFFKPAKNHL
eukprot:UN10132